MKTGPLHKYKERFNVYPKFDKVVPREPSKETKSYITHLQIKYARRRSKQCSQKKRFMWQMEIKEQ